MRRIADRFVIEGPLGTGGMGSLYRARDERLGEMVAVKILKRSLTGDPVLRERFRREALSLAKLRHPGIVTVFDSGESDGDLYTVLELVRGETLEKVMEREGSMAMVRAAPLFDQILVALDACHESEIVHRDVKPSNVMVDGGSDAPRVKLIDFGLARMASRAIAKLTETGAVQGTPHYMSPEQCRGEDVGPPSDVYSAGVLFYEMLSGGQPFRGEDAATFMAQHLFVEPTPLWQVAPHVSTGASAAVHAALSKQPQDRPTARELKGALASALEGTDPEAQAETAAALRSQTSGRSRLERALGGPSVAAPLVAGAPHASKSGNATGNVLVWVSGVNRGAALRGCLATAGLSCSLGPHATAEPPPDISAANVVVVSAREGMSRVLRLHAFAPKLPIVVVDVAGPDETTAAIRAGASDMLLREAPDADLVAKLTRILRKRARP